MKTKIFTLVLLSSMAFNTAFALTQADIDLLVAAGFIPVNKVSAANNAVKSSNTSTTKTQTPFVYGSGSTSSGSSCLKITTDLFMGSTGSVVTSLQNFLKSKGHFAETATGYYGAITQSAVENFQKAQGIALNGTPETTGFGKVGPSTRSVIEKISCTGSTSSDTSFFGYNLDDLFKPVNYDYDVQLNTDIAFDTNIDFNTDIAFDTRSDYRPMDIDFDDIDFDTDIEFNTNLKNYNPVIKDGVGVSLFVKAVNGKYVRGGSTAAVAVEKAQVELLWESNNVKGCILSGDFKEKRLSVPVAGSASLSMINPTGGRYVNGDSLYHFGINCAASSTRAYSLPSSDAIKLWIYRPATTTTP